MPMPSPPITWNQRLNAWDNLTIEALQERIGRSPIIFTEIATLFANTMDWARTHPFNAENTQALLQCWNMIVLGTSIPWMQHSTNGDHDFLPTLVGSDPKGVLDYLQARVHGRLRDREQHTAWIAQALHVACHLQADEVAPVLNALAKTWTGDVRRSQEFAHVVGKNASYFPWPRMHELHTKFHAYPAVQKAILQWDSLCTAEHVYQASTDPVLMWSPETVFKDQGAASAFHAHTMALTLAGAHLQRQWGWAPEAMGATDKKSVPLSENTLHVMEKTWSMLVNLVEPTDVGSLPHGLDLALLQACASWCMDSAPFNRRVIQFNKQEAILVGHKPYFQQAVQGQLGIAAASHDNVGAGFLGMLLHLDQSVWHEHRAFVSQCVQELLLDFVASNDPFLTLHEIPSYMTLLTSDAIDALASSDDVHEQLLFWRIVENADALSDGVRRELIDRPSMRKALLLATLVESYGVAHWDVLPDHSHAWARTLPVWYPEHMVLWEHVQREMLREPSKSHDEMLQALLRVQGIAHEHWEAIRHLVDAPEKHKIARQALAPSRSWNVGMPQLAKELAWVATALTEQLVAEVLELPSLHCASEVLQ